MTPDTAAGCLFGLAYGDALGKSTEFRTVAEIVARYGPSGPRTLTGDPALVTDDTQMTLAVGRALRRPRPTPSPSCATSSWRGRSAPRTTGPPATRACRPAPAWPAASPGRTRP